MTLLEILMASVLMASIALFLFACLADLDDVPETDKAQDNKAYIAERLTEIGREYLRAEQSREGREGE